MNKPEDLKRTDERPPAKRRYATPRLSIYGDLRLTSSSVAGTMGDAGVHPATMSA